MVRYQGGESDETVAGKRGHMAEAQPLWPFPAPHEMTALHNAPQLCSMVRDRTGSRRSEADRAVDGRTDGKTF